MSRSDRVSRGGQTHISDLLALFLQGFRPLGRWQISRIRGLSSSCLISYDVDDGADDR